MKKAFYMMAAAAIALSSCSSEETTDVAKSSNITFRSAVGFNTRGIEMTNADGYKMTKMTVSAFDESGAEFFKNYVFTENNGEFTSSEHPSWPNHGSLNFVAYSHSGGDWTGAAPVLKKMELQLLHFHLNQKLENSWMLSLLREQVTRLVMKLMDYC